MGQVGQGYLLRVHGARCVSNTHLRGIETRPEHVSYPRIIERLAAGERVTLQPSGQSMTPRIKSKQTIVLIPIDRIQVGDVVLAKVTGKHYIHLLSAIDGDRVQISNNHGHVNGWTHRTKVFGRVIDV